MPTQPDTRETSGPPIASRSLERQWRRANSAGGSRRRSTVYTAPYVKCAPSDAAFEAGALVVDMSATVDVCSLSRFIQSSGEGIEPDPHPPLHHVHCE
jgi:hypothetical protein